MNARECSEAIDRTAAGPWLDILNSLNNRLARLEGDRFIGIATGAVRRVGRGVFEQEVAISGPWQSATEAQLRAELEQVRETNVRLGRDLVLAQEASDRNFRAIADQCARAEMAIGALREVALAVSEFMRKDAASWTHSQQLRETGIVLSKIHGVARAAMRATEHES